MSGFYVQHLMSRYARANIFLYQGRAHDALTLLDDTLRSARRAFLYRMQIARIEGAGLRARALLAALDDGGEVARVRGAAREAARMAGEKQPWAVALASLVEAAVAWRRGGAERAVPLLTRAERELPFRLPRSRRIGRPSSSAIST